MQYTVDTNTIQWRCSDDLWMPVDATVGHFSLEQDSLELYPMSSTVLEPVTQVSSQACSIFDRIVT